LPGIPTRHRGAARPSGHQFDQSMRTDAESPGASVTTGQPAGCGSPFACQPAGLVPNVTPDVIGFRFPSSRVISGVPSSVQVLSEKFVRVIAPTRDPAAPVIDPFARSMPDVHECEEGVGCTDGV